MAEELKPCGCGGKPELRDCEPDYYNSVLYIFWVECDKCGIQTDHFYDEDEAIEAWNDGLVHENDFRRDRSK